jgi:hypothetical protein
MRFSDGFGGLSGSNAILNWPRNRPQSLHASPPKTEYLFWAHSMWLEE